VASSAAVLLTCAAPAAAVDFQIAWSVFTEDPTGIEVDELRYDGRPDLAISSANDDLARVLFGGPLAFGLPTFGPASPYTAGDEPSDLVTNVGNVANMVVANRESESVSLFLSTDGFGTYGVPTSYPVAAGPVSVDDVQFDSRLVVGYEALSAVGVLTYDGFSSFTGPAFFPTGNGPTDARFETLESGFPDIIAANAGSDTVSVLLDDGPATFEPQDSYPVGDDPVAIEVGPLGNRFGPNDIVTANNDEDTVSVLTNDGAGSFAAAVDYPAGDGPSDVGIGDFNGDFIPDIAVVNEIDDTVSILPGLQSGAFASAEVFDPALGSDLRVMAVKDFNGDALDDLVIGGGNETTVYSNSSLPVLEIPEEADGLAFDDQEVGTISPSKLVTLNNTGDAPLKPTIIRTGSGPGPGSNDFLISFDNCSGSQIAPGSFCQVGVRFAPSIPDVLRNPSLYIRTNAEQPFRTVPLTGTGAQPSPGPAGPAGPAGAPGPQGPPGRDALVTCKSKKKKKKVTCKVTFTASAASVRASLSQGGRTYARGAAETSGGRTTLPLLSDGGVAPGRYLLTVKVSTGKGKTVVTKRRVRIR
jgi:hypothetical protein